MMDHLAALAKIERLEAQLERLRGSQDRLLAAGKAIIAYLQHEPLEAGGLLSSDLQTAITTAEKLTP